MKRIKAVWLYALLACLALPALSRALELELEENRAQNGTIGFIDLDRIFQEYPETLRAKAQFEAEVNEKRVDIQRRKREVLDLKEKLADLQIEREKLLKEQLLEPAVIPAAPSAPAASTAAVAATQLSSAAVSVSTAAAAPRMSPQDLAAALAASSAPVQVPVSVVKASTAPVLPAATVSTMTVVPAPSVSKSSAAAAAAPLPLEVGPTGSLAVSASSAPAIRTAPLNAASTGLAPAVFASSAAIKAPSIPVVSTAPLAAATTVAAVAAPPAPPSAAAAAASEQNALVAVKIKDVDARIDALQHQIVEKDTAFQDYEAKVEADLRVLEKHRVKLLLGKIYDVVQEVAKDEGLSVVEDKKNILFGQDAVDLTDKVLARLKQE